MISRIRAALAGTKPCPFCQHCPPLTRHRDLGVHQDVYSCAHCSSHFTVDPNGVLEVVYTARMRSPPDSPNTSCGYPDSLQPSNGAQSLLCQACNNYQSVVVQLLAGFEGDLEGDAGEYRREVERRYPLCATCQFAVAERLRQIDFKVRCSRIGGKQAMTMRKGAVKRPRWLVFVVVNLVDFGTNLAILYGTFWALPVITLNLVVQLLGRDTTIRNITLTLLAVCLRLLLFARVFEPTMVVYYAFISTLFLVPLIYRPSTRRMSFYQNTPKPTSEGEDMVSLSENIRPSSINSLGSLSLSSGSTPGQTKNRNPFELKMKTTPNRSSVRLRPTPLEHRGQSAGLEDLFMNGFRISEASTQCEPKDNYLESFRQTILSLLMCVFRVWAGNRVPMIVGVLMASFGLGHYWLLKLGIVRIVYLGLTVLRLVSLGLEASDQFANPLPTPFIVLDCLLLALR